LILFLSLVCSSAALVGIYRFSVPGFTSQTLPGVTALYDFNSTYFSMALTLTQSPMLVSWIGFGLFWSGATYTSGYEMNGGVIVAYWNGTAGGVCDGYLNSPTSLGGSGSVPPTKQTTSDVTLVGTSSNSSSWTVEFVRPLAASDSTHQAILLGQTQDIFFSVNPGPSPIPSTCVLVPTNDHYNNNGPGYFIQNFDFTQSSQTTAPPTGGPTQAVNPDITYTNTQTFLDGDYTLNWYIDTVANTIQINVQVQTPGWIGFGLGQNMFSANTYQSYMDTVNDVAVVIEGLATAQAQPQPVVASTSVLGATGSYVGGVTSVHFLRDLDPGNGISTTISNEDTACIISYNAVTSTTSVQHTVTMDGISINFFTGASSASSPTQTMRMWHGILMFTAWGILVVVAMFLARFFKSLGKPWFWLHIALNSAGILLYLIAFILVLVAISNDSETHFIRDTSTDSGASLFMAHAWIGLIVMIAGVAQPFIGYLADKKFDPKREGAPIWPDMTHWWIGRGAIIMALINIYLGIFVIDGLYGTVLWTQVVYGIWFGLIIFIYIGLAAYQKIKGVAEH